MAPKECAVMTAEEAQALFGRPLAIDEGIALAEAGQWRTFEVKAAARGKRFVSVLRVPGDGGRFVWGDAAASAEDALQSLLRTAKLGFADRLVRIAGTAVKGRQP